MIGFFTADIDDDYFENGSFTVLSDSTRNELQQQIDSSSQSDQPKSLNLPDNSERSTLNQGNEEDQALPPYQSLPASNVWARSSQGASNIWARSSGGAFSAGGITSRGQGDNRNLVSPNFSDEGHAEAEYRDQLSVVDTDEQYQAGGSALELKL